MSNLLSWLVFLPVFGLFSTGQGGRHDWMRFHADEVPCPLNSRKTRIMASIPCPGTLKWKDNTHKVLICDSCAAEFGVRLKVRNR